MIQAQPTQTPLPTLSLRERDRRWAAVRGLMREQGVDCLLVAGFRSREMYESYVSDDYNEGAVVFPLDGDPVVLTWAHLRVLRDLPLTGNTHALAITLEGQAVIAALNAVFDDLAEMQWRGAVAAAVSQCRRFAGAVAEQDDWLVADATGERACTQFIGPGPDVPSIVQQHGRIPRQTRQIAADRIASPALKEASASNPFQEDLTGS